MAHKKGTLSVIGVLFMVWLAACSPSAPTSTPTLNLDPFRTEVRRHSAGTGYPSTCLDAFCHPSFKPHSHEPAYLHAKSDSQPIDQRNVYSVQ